MTESQRWGRTLYSFEELETAAKNAVRTRFHLRKPVFDGEIARVELTRGMHAIIDAQDAARVGLLNWYASPHHRGFIPLSQVPIGGRSIRVHLHSWIMRPPAGIVVDHINHEPLDNRRSNLRFATCGLNNVNRRLRSSTGFRGVSTRKDKYVAAISLGKTRIRLGYDFETAEDAARAYDAAARELHGEFAVLNFPENT